MVTADSTYTADSLLTADGLLPGVVTGEVSLPENYRAQLAALLPTGLAWPRDPDSTLQRLLAAWSESFARLGARAQELVAETDPRAALALLPDWERVAGLPDSCSAGIATTLSERRAALVDRLTAGSGASKAYFQDIAERLGYQVEIEEFRPFICGMSRCGDPLNGAPSVRYYWRVRVVGPRLTQFRAGASQIGDRLGKITRATDLECLLTRLAPAHTTVIVTYEGT